MAKILIETTGEFMLTDMSNGQTIQSHRPSVVERTSFVDARSALGQIVKLADVPDEATDTDFAGYWTDAGQADLAISSFLSQFEVEAEKPKKAAK